MNAERRDIDRREVIEFYLRYECAGKPRSLPDLDAWAWTSADELVLSSRAREQVGIVAATFSGTLLRFRLATYAAAPSRADPTGHTGALGRRARAAFLPGYPTADPRGDGLHRGERLCGEDVLIIRPAVRSVPRLGTLRMGPAEGGVSCEERLGV